MADLTPSERLQPCLLDRLIDDKPQSKQESRDKRVINLQYYRQAVLRDLSWLLNTPAHIEQDGLDEFEEVPSSVLNYGVRDLSGKTTSEVPVKDMEKHMMDVIGHFEPRIHANSLAFKVIRDPNAMNRRAVCLEIRGDLWAYPLSEALYLKTQLDVEQGQYKSPEVSGG